MLLYQCFPPEIGCIFGPFTRCIIRLLLRIILYRVSSRLRNYCRWW